MNKENTKYANLLYNVAVENAHYLNSGEKAKLKEQFKKLANNESQSNSNVNLDEVNEKLDKVVKAISYNASEIQKHTSYAKIDCRNDITTKLKEVEDNLTSKGAMTFVAACIGCIIAISACIFILMKSFDVTIDIENPNPEQNITVKPSE
jgi:hypothetical protein